MGKKDFEKHHAAIFECELVKIELALANAIFVAKEHFPSSPTLERLKEIKAELENIDAETLLDE